MKKLKFALLSGALLISSFSTLQTYAYNTESEQQLVSGSIVGNINLAILDNAESILDEAIARKEAEEADKQKYLGSFYLTAYCSCAKCCGKYAYNRPHDKNGNEIVYGSTGERLTSELSIAVDPKVIPYGSVVVIDGKEYIAQDCGGKIKGNRIDVYYSSHSKALAFATGNYEVYLKE